MYAIVSQASINAVTKQLKRETPLLILELGTAVRLQI
jgi:hypothetical protein